MAQEQNENFVCYVLFVCVCVCVCVCVREREREREREQEVKQARISPVRLPVQVIVSRPLYTNYS